MSEGYLRIGSSFLKIGSSYLRIGSATPPPEAGVRGIATRQSSTPGGGITYTGTRNVDSTPITIAQTLYTANTPVGATGAQILVAGQQTEIAKIDLSGTVLSTDVLTSGVTSTYQLWASDVLPSVSVLADENLNVCWIVIDPDTYGGFEFGGVAQNVGDTADFTMDDPSSPGNTADIDIVRGGSLDLINPSVYLIAIV